MLKRNLKPRNWENKRAGQCDSIKNYKYTTIKVSAQKG